MELSIVIPVYNEEESIEPLIREIDGVLAPLKIAFEIVAVDDGSKDSTFALCIYARHNRGFQVAALGTDARNKDGHSGTHRANGA